MQYNFICSDFVYNIDEGFAYGTCEIEGFAYGTCEIEGFYCYGPRITKKIYYKKHSQTPFLSIISYSYNFNQILPESFTKLYVFVCIWIATKNSGNQKWTDPWNEVEDKRKLSFRHEGVH